VEAAAAVKAAAVALTPKCGAAKRKARGVCKRN
jgi:hypothetical protein